MKKSASILTVISFLLTAHAESIVWNKDNDFNNWRHFFNVSGKIENGFIKLTGIKFDPQMSNRAVTIDPKNFDTLVYTCKVTGPGPKKTGEFYFWQTGSKANPRQSWQLPELICDGEFHTYSVRPADLTTWLECGTVSGIRLDITNSAGGTIEIQEIRLEKSSTATSGTKDIPALVWNKENNFKPWKYFLHSKGVIANGMISFTEIKFDCGIEARNITPVDPEAYNTISFTYRAASTGNLQGQFFFKNDNMKFSEKTRVTLPALIADGKWHTIECQIQNPAWKECGKITSLRLDPTDSAGGTLDISEIKLLKKDYPENVKKNVDSSNIKPSAAVTVPDGKLDAPKWQAEKSELWQKNDTKTAVPEKYFKGSMIRSPQDLYKGSKYQDFYLRKTFELDKTPVLGFLQFTADDCAQAFVNGQLAGVSNDWSTGVSLDVSKFLKQGKNTLAFHYVNSSTYGGVLAELYVQYADGSCERINSDKSFKSSVNAANSWNRSDFNDAQWEPVIEQSAPPAAPWKVVIPYQFFSNMQKIEMVDITPKTVNAGENITLSLLCMGKIPEKSFSADIVLKRGQMEFLRDKVTLTEKNFIPQSKDKWLLKFDYPIHLYAPEGNFDIGVSSDIFSIQGKNMQISVKKATHDPNFPTDIKFQVNRKGERPFFELNGKPFYLCMTGTTFTPAKINCTVVYPNFLTLHCAAGKINSDELDRAIIKSARNYPDAYFIIKLRMDISSDWTERFPDELCRDEDYKINYYGGHGAFCYSSKAALQEMLNNLEKIINYLESGPYSSRILGYMIVGGDTIEWLGWRSQSGKALDFSGCAVKAYKQFAAENYPDLKNPYVPGTAERSARDGNSLLFDQQKHLNLIAYNEFTSDAVANVVINLCRKVKEMTGDSKVVGTYYGYTSTLNYTGQAHSRAHFALKKVLASGAVDFLMSPQSYPLRALGETCGEMKPFATLANNGIVSVLENDQRTHNSLYDTVTSGGRYQTINHKQTLNIYRRDMIMAIIRRQPGYMIQIKSGHELNFPQVVQEAEIIKLLGQWSLDKQNHRRAEVALVVSEKSITSLPKISEFAWSGITDQSYRGDGSVRTELRHKPLLNFETFIGNHGLFNRSGAAIDQLLAEDLADNPGDYKLYVFLNCYKYDKKFQQAINKLQQKKCVLLWLYAPGYTKNIQSSVEYMQQLTGLKFEKLSLPHTSTVQFANNRIMGTPQAKVTPLFAVNDPDAEILARYSNGKAGVAMKKNGNALNIFSGAWQLDLDFIDFVLEKAGVFQYSSTRDPLDADSNLIMLHARTPGNKTIRLPYKTDVLDVFNRKIIARNTDSFTTGIKLHETKCFYYGNEAENLLSELNKIK
ncbi:MAG: hypothetical protein IKD23_03840 [Lentisphaeria bacterium]|nr:hypothetical protein [Lentisphaeria bacterium]